MIKKKKLEKESLTLSCLRDSFGKAYLYQEGNVSIFTLAWFELSTVDEGAPSREGPDGCIALLSHSF